MRQVHECEIQGVISICPYCGYPQKGKLYCCGETHFIDAYIVGNEVLTCDEVELLKERETPRVLN